MPTLDMSAALLDPTIGESFNVIRRDETVGSNGRSVLTPSSIPDPQFGVFIPSGGSLDRADDSQMMKRVGALITRFKLRGVGEGFQPDQVLLAGITYTVKEVLPFSRFGPGFTEAVIESMNATDPAG